MKRNPHAAAASVPKPSFHCPGLRRYVGPRSREDKSLEALIASQQLEQPTQLLPLPLTQLQPQLGPQAPGPGEQPHVQPDAMPEAGPLGAAEQQPMEADGAGPAGPMLSPHGDDDGFFDGGGGGPEDWPADAEPMREAAGATAAGVAEGEQQPGEAPQAEAGLERPRRAAAAAAAGGAVAVADAGAAGAGEEQEDEEEFDPYKPLDPASKGRMPDRPLVVSGLCTLLTLARLSRQHSAHQQYPMKFALYEKRTLRP